MLKSEFGQLAAFILRPVTLEVTSLPSCAAECCQHSGRFHRRFTQCTK